MQNGARLTEERLRHALMTCAATGTGTPPTGVGGEEGVLLALAAQASAEYRVQRSAKHPAVSRAQGFEALRIFWTRLAFFWKTTPSRPSVPRLSGPCKPVLLGVL
jgi:hypothetical protein